jgi:hypothetical protein
MELQGVAASGGFNVGAARWECSRYGKAKKVRTVKIFNLSLWHKNEATITKIVEHELLNCFEVRTKSGNRLFVLRAVTEAPCCLGR